MTPRQDPKKTAAGLEGSSYDLPAREKQPEKKKPKKEKITPVGVYLDENMRVGINRIIKKHGVKRHALLQYAIIYFLQEYEKDPGILEFKKSIKKPE